MVEDPEASEQLYVYAVVPAGLVATDLGTGIDGAPVDIVTTPAGVAAVVHRHSGPPYAGSDRDAERRVLEHGDLVERSWKTAGSVLPMGFDVIVAPGEGLSARERLIAWLTRSAPGLSDRLATLAGLVELRVEVSLDEEAAVADSDEVRQLTEEIGMRTPGVQRLLQRRLRSLRKDLTDQLADELYPEYRRRIAGLTVDITENVRGHPPPGSILVLNLAVLVREEDIARLGSELAAIEAEQPAIHVRFLGPWPPFSFAEPPALGSEGAPPTVDS